MRHSLILLLLVSVTAVYAEAPPERPVETPVQRFVFVALAKDSVRAAEVEAALKTSFSEHGVKSDSIRTLFATSVPVPQMIDHLRADGYDHLLCIAPRKTVRITTPDYTLKMSTMQSCLKSYTTGSLPTGEPLEVAPFTIETPRTNPTGSAPSRNSPIPTNSSAAPLTVIKGTIRMFDMGSEQLSWENDLQVKMPAELPTEMQTKMIAKEVWQVIEKSGVLPKK